MKYTACVQALSCDEAYLDVTGLGDPELLAAAIRAEIAATTQCNASAGASGGELCAGVCGGKARGVSVGVGVGVGVGVRACVCMHAYLYVGCFQAPNFSCSCTSVSTHKTFAPLRYL